MLAPGDEARVALVQFAHVDHVHLAASEERAEGVELDRPERLELLRPLEVALELEQSHRAQPPGRQVGLGACRRVQDDLLVAPEHEAGPRPEALDRHRHVQRAGHVAGGEGVGAPDVENGCVVRRPHRPGRRGVAEERAPVQLDDPFHVRRPRRHRLRRLVDELGHRRDRQQRVSPALGPDRRGRRGAHSGAAQRAGDVPGEDLDVVGELEEPVQAAEHALGALPGLDDEVGPGDGADEKRIACEERAVDEEAAVLGAVTGSVDRPRRDRAGRERVAVREGVMRKRGYCVAMDRDRDVVLQRQPSVTRYVVGVRVRLQHAHDAHARLFGRGQVRLDRVGGVDQQCLARVGVADEVGGAPEVLVDELPEQHPALTLAAGLAVFPIVTLQAREIGRSALVGSEPHGQDERGRESWCAARGLGGRRWLRRPPSSEGARVPRRGRAGTLGACPSPVRG